MNATKFNYLLTAFAIAFLLALQACKPDEPPTTTEELITTIEVNFSDSANSSDKYTYIYKDTDGDGGNPPEKFDTIKLVQGKTYFCTLKILDESGSSTKDITEEIKNESADHLFCFAVRDINSKIKRTDTDGTFEIGIESKWLSGSAGNGFVRITLKHQPGVKNGQCDPGATDIDIDFPVQIK